MIEDSCFRQIELAGVLRGARNEDGARKLDRLHALEAVPGGHPAADVRLPGTRDAALPPEFEQFAVVPESPLELPPEEIEDQPRALGGRVDGHRDSLSGRAWRALTLGVPLAFLALFFVYPLAAIVERGLRGEGDVAARRPTDPLTREVVWFTVWQALASTVLTIAVALPAA